MVGSSLPVCVEAPQVYGKKESKKSKEQARNLKPEHPRGVRKRHPDRTPKPARTLPQLASPLGVDRSVLLGAGCGVLRRNDGSVSQQASGHARSNAQRSANSICFHAKSLEHFPACTDREKRRKILQLFSRFSKEARCCVLCQSRVGVQSLFCLSILLNSGESACMMKSVGCGSPRLRVGWLKERFYFGRTTRETRRRAG